jgi:DNA-binding Lrp family transcriptional regulator
MKQIKIDNIDLKILEILQKNGRISNLELSKQVGLSPPPCLRRLKILEESGYIESYKANLSDSKLGFNIVVFVFITLSSQQEEVLNQLKKDISKIEMIRESYIISGEFDFILKVVARDWEQYNKMLTKYLTNNPNIVNIRSSLMIKKIKSNADIKVANLIYNY